MKTSVDFYDFKRAFEAHGRMDQFSKEGLSALFDHLEQWEEDCGEEIELDVIALCCDFYEDTWTSIADNYSIDLTDAEDEEEKIQAVEDYLNYHSVCVARIESGGEVGFIYQAF